MPESTRQIAAIMFTDIVGYTALMGNDEQKAFESLRKNRVLQKPIISKFNGRFIKELGDGTLASFNTVSDAVYAAIEIQKACRDEHDFQLRIGIHLGEVVFENDDVFGDGVNIASRIQAVTEPGEIYVSESVSNNVSNKAGIVTRFIRQESLKNVKEPAKIYKVIIDADQLASKAGSSPSTNRPAAPTRTKQWAILVLLVILVGVALTYYLRPEKSTVEKERSIAVLPLRNLSADEENQFFADGLVEDMLNRLSMIENFKVISRTSSQMYRDKGTKSVPQIAKELGVSYIVEGSVQRVAGKARISIQLIDGEKDVHIWAETFDRDLEDIFKIQSEVAVQIAHSLNALLTSQETMDIQRNRTSNVEAFELYQLGRFHWNKRTAEGYAASIDYFEKAIADDPDYGLAYAGLADTYNLMALQGHINRKEGRDKAVELAKRALQLDAGLAEAHNVLASIYTNVDSNWAAAEQGYLRAIELNPNYSTAHHYYSEHLSIVGRHDEARKEIDKAAELDPLSFIIHFVSQKLYFHRGLFKEALNENQRCHELQDGHPWLRSYDLDINLHLKREEATLNILKTRGLRDGSFTETQVDSAFNADGYPGLIKIELRNTYWNFRKAELYGYLSENQIAMDLLEELFNNNNAGAEFVFYYGFRNLRPNPRFQAILRRMNLPPD